MGTAKDLSITSWNREPTDSPFTVAVPGIKFTGWWPHEQPGLLMFRDLETIWPRTLASLKCEVDILEDPDGRRHQICVYARILRYPQNWLSLVCDSLKYFIQHGAAISWAGGWECFLQYSPLEKFAGCYAAYSASTGFVCYGDLEEPVTYLDKIPTVADRLHSAVAEVIHHADNM